MTLASIIFPPQTHLFMLIQDRSFIPTQSAFLETNAAIKNKERVWETATI